MIVSRTLMAMLMMVAAGCEHGSPRGSADPRADAAWAAFTHRFIEDSFEAQPKFAVDAGRHEFDGRMPDWSAAGIAREIARLKEARREAARFAPDALTPAQRFEREYLLSVIDTDLFWLDRARWPFTNPVWYIEELDADVYLRREYAPLETRLKAYIAYARAVPRLAADIRANLRVPMPKSYVERGIDGFGGYAEFYRTTPRLVFATVQDDALQRDLAAANDAAAAAMDELKRWFESELPRATDNFALGTPLFIDMLRHTERIDVPLPQLAAAGRADLERNLDALRRACGVYLPQGSLEACVVKMAAKKPQGGAVEGAQNQLAALKAFVAEKGLVTIPGDESVQVRESPPYYRANLAYINIPGPYEKGMPSIYYVAPADPRWQAAEQAAYVPSVAALLYTSVHEVWPGHFLQFLHANRNPSRIASLWFGYAFTEGWAHYSEELMWESGLGDNDPEQHIGLLTAALLRNVRFLCAIGLHTEGMSVAEAERLFRDSVFANPGMARQQAARGTYDPGYLNYTLGKLMIRKLRADWVAQQAGGDSSADPKRLWRAFHDQLLSYGGPPLPLARKAMVGEAGSLL